MNKATIDRKEDVLKLLDMPEEMFWFYLYHQSVLDKVKEGIRIIDTLHCEPLTSRKAV